MKRQVWIKSKSGTSLIEVMIAAFILSVILSGLMYFVQIIVTEQHRVLTLSTQEKLLQGIAADLRADSAVYQKNFAATAVSNATVLADANLPLLWNDDVVCDRIRDAGCCQACIGRMGYTIRPINGNPGLFMTTVRLSHPELLGGELWYEFIMVPK